MARAWRIVQAHLAEAAFTGEGARLYGGRWNHAGTPVVYTAGSRSLALLELLAHAEARLLARPYVVIPVAFPDELLRRLAPGELPEGWDANPPGNGPRDLGTAWVDSAECVALAVPSALVPQEENYLLNPRHADFSRVTVGEAEPLRVDERFRAPGPA